MTLTLKSKAFLRRSSKLPRTTCSGRANGACNLGLRTILGGSALGSLEAWITVSSLHRGYLGLRTITERPMGCHYGPLRPSDKDLYTQRPLHNLLDDDRRLQQAKCSSLALSSSQPGPGGFRQHYIIPQIAAGICNLGH